jgi:hypothetical protein
MWAQKEMEGGNVAQHLLYGIRNSGVFETAETIGARLGCTFHERESDYLGIYMLASSTLAEIKVVSQPDPEGDPLEDDFDDYSTLVYVEAHQNFPELDGVRVASEKLAKLRFEQ